MKRIVRVPTFSAIIALRFAQRGRADEPQALSAKWLSEPHPAEGATLFRPTNTAMLGAVSIRRTRWQRA
ncbi:MAG: hypothetical protein ACKVN9_08025 [Methylophilaceae bacterium]